MIERRKLIETISPGQNWDYQICNRDINDTNDKILKANSFVFFAPESLNDFSGLPNDFNRQIQNLSELILNFTRRFNALDVAIRNAHIGKLSFIIVSFARIVRARGLHIDSNVQPALAESISDFRNDFEILLCFNKMVDELRSLINDLGMADLLAVPDAEPHAINPPNIEFANVPKQRFSITNNQFSEKSIYTAGITSYEAKYGESIEVAVSGTFSLPTSAIKISEKDKRHILAAFRDVEGVIPAEGYDYTTFMYSGSGIYWDYGFEVVDHRLINNKNKAGLYFSPDYASKGSVITRFYLGKIIDPVRYKIHVNADLTSINISFITTRFKFLLNGWMD